MRRVGNVFSLSIAVHGKSIACPSRGSRRLAVHVVHSTRCLGWIDVLARGVDDFVVQVWRHRGAVDDLEILRDADVGLGGDVVVNGDEGLDVEDPVSVTSRGCDFHVAVVTLHWVGGCVRVPQTRYNARDGAFDG